MNRGGFWRIRSGVGDWVSCGIDTLFPPVCPCCQTRVVQPGLCETCVESLFSSAEAVCLRCAAPVPPHDRSGAQGCPQCQGESWLFHRVIALGPYRGALREAVIRMKHASEHPLAFQVGRHLGLLARSQLSHDLPDMLIPVPMYWYRRFRRGINSAFVLADGASSVLERPVAAQVLWCCRATSKQSMLSVRERLQNVRHSFRFWRPRALSNRHVAIVDDTMTTGATAHELACLLTSAGAQRVTVLVAARAIAEWKQTGRGRPSRPSPNSKLPQRAR